MNCKVWLAGATVIAVGCGSSDMGLTTSVKSRLAADNIVNAYQINVDTRDRVVTLTGTVRTLGEETQALAIARGTDGVRGVVDHIAVRPDDATSNPADGSLVETVKDASITAAVKAKLLADSRVSGLDIDVDTEDGNVSLSGTVHSPAERSRAIELAGQVEGVKNVTANLKVEGQGVGGRRIGLPATHGPDSSMFSAWHQRHENWRDL